MYVYTVCIMYIHHLLTIIYLCCNGFSHGTRHVVLRDFDLNGKRPLRSIRRMDDQLDPNLMHIIGTCDFAHLLSYIHMTRIKTNGGSQH